MIKCRHVFFLKILIFSWILILVGNSVSQAGKITKRKVELEWDQQPLAKYYDVEVYFEDGKSLYRAYQIPTNFFKQTLPLGAYKVRSRFMLNSAELSPWSKLEPLEVLVPAGQIKNLDGESFFKVDLQTGVAKVALLWTPIDNIKYYKIELHDKTGKTVLSTKTQKAPLNVTLPPGEYKYAVTPFDEYGNEGDPSEDSPTIIVSTAQIPPPILESIKEDEALKMIKWKGFRTSALEGKLFYRKIMATDWIFKQNFKNIKTSPWIPPGNLEPGEYQILFHSEIKGADPSETVGVEFLVKPTKKDLSGIFDGY